MVRRVLFGVLVVLLAAATAALWLSLPTLIGLAVALDRTSPGLERLRVAHRMAGGLARPHAADEAIAGALKAMAVSGLLGARSGERLRCDTRTCDLSRTSAAPYVGPSLIAL